MNMYIYRLPGSLEGEGEGEGSSDDDETSSHNQDLGHDQCTTCMLIADGSTVFSPVYQRPVHASVLNKPLEIFLQHVLFKSVAVAIGCAYIHVHLSIIPSLSFACTRYSNYDTQLISISGVSSYVINDRLFPVLLHSSSGEDSLGVRCPVCEGKYSHDEPPTRFVRSVPAKLNYHPPHISLHVH